MLNNIIFVPRTYRPRAWGGWVSSTFLFFQGMMKLRPCKKKPSLFQSDPIRAISSRLNIGNILPLMGCHPESSSIGEDGEQTKRRIVEGTSFCILLARSLFLGKNSSTVGSPRLGNGFLSQRSISHKAKGLQIGGSLLEETHSVSLEGPTLSCGIVEDLLSFRCKWVESGV